ncbi:MAG: hypothetical protein GF344_10205 [Chitinivibrionales bacterium]|nr:hypothetical protein [Chitinivibrionales bacterium]
MRIGIVSDTHRNKEGLERAVDWLQNRQRIVSLYHLGDDYEDVIDLADTGLEVVQVPGIYHPKYRDGTLPKVVRETVLGLRVVLVHCLGKDLPDEDRSVTDIILHGHTHHPDITVVDGRLTMNPGHLKSHRDKSIDPSFGFLDIQERSVRAVIYAAKEFEELESVDLVRSENGLYRA